MEEVILALLPTATTDAVVTVFLSLIGGLGSYLHGVRTSRIERKAFEFFTEVLLALIVGLIVMNAAASIELPSSVTAVLILTLTNNSDESILEFKSHLMQRLRYRMGMKPIKATNSTNDEQSAINKNERGT